MQRMTRTSIAGLVLLWCASGSAQGEAVSQTVGHGQINWSDKVITATGSGAPSLKAANVAVARLGAERAAKMDAFRNIIESVKGVRVSGKASAGSVMDSSPQTKARVEGVVRNFKVMDTKYYSDGGVDVIVQVPLDGVLLEALVQDAGKSAATGAASDGTTGIVVNATGLGLTPALAPRIVDDKGAEVFAASLVSKEAIQQHGVVGYSKSMDSATKHKRVAGKPVIVRALKTTEPGSSDLVVSAADGAKLTKLKGVLGQGKVIIVTD